MSVLAERLKERYFRDEDHPYRLFEAEVAALLRPGQVLLDAGCGYTAPVLRKFQGRAGRLVGVDLVEFADKIDGVELYQSNLAKIPVENDSIDVAMSRSVMEHLADPLSVYVEIKRVLRPGGHFVFLTGNYWDYAAIIAKLVPNRWHPWIVARTEGRAEKDVFPVEYKTNTRSAVDRWAGGSGMEIISFRYLGQYPSYFMFNGPLFMIATAYEKTISRFDALRGLRGWILVTLQKPVR